MERRPRAVGRLRAPSVPVPESLIRDRPWRGFSRTSPSAGAHGLARCTALQIALTTRFRCLRVSGAVAPSAPGPLCWEDPGLSRIVTMGRSRIRRSAAGEKPARPAGGRFRRQPVRVVTAGSPPGHPGVTAGSPPGHRRVTAGSPPGHRRVTAGSPPGHRRVTAGSPPGHRRVTAGSPPGHRRVTAGSPPGHRRVTAGSPPGHRRVTAGSPPGHRRVTAGSPPGHRRVTAGSPPGHRGVTAESPRERSRPPAVDPAVGRGIPEDGRC